LREANPVVVEVTLGGPLERALARLVSEIGARLLMNRSDEAAGAFSM